MSKTKAGMPWCKLGFEPFSEGGNRGGPTNLIRKSILNSRSIKSKSKTITNLFHRLMDSRLKLGNDKEITTTLTATGTVRTTVGRDIWSKVLGKTSVKKLINKGGCFKH